MKFMPPARRLTGIILFMVLTGCAALGSRPDADLGREQAQKAENFYTTRQYGLAAEQIELAVKNLPHDGLLAARQGELLEQLEQYGEARAAYRRGLKMTKDNLVELHYQLGRLEAYHYNRPDKAELLAGGLATGSWQKDDLEALAMISRGEGREALTQLSRLIDRVPDQASAAFIFFDIALAHELLGNIPQSYTNLFKSVNRVEHKGLSRQIEIYWQHLKKAHPLEKSQIPES